MLFYPSNYKNSFSFREQLFCKFASILTILLIISVLGDPRFTIPDVSLILFTILKSIWFLCFWGYFFGIVCVIEKENIRNGYKSKGLMTNNELECAQRLLPIFWKAGMFLSFCVPFIRPKELLLSFLLSCAFSFPIVIIEVCHVTLQIWRSIWCISRNCPPRFRTETIVMWPILLISLALLYLAALLSLSSYPILRWIARHVAGALSDWLFANLIMHLFIRIMQHIAFDVDEELN